VLAHAMTEPMRPIEWTDADEHAAEPTIPPADASGDAAVRH